MSVTLEQAAEAVKSPNAYDAVHSAVNRAGNSAVYGPVYPAVYSAVDEAAYWPVHSAVYWFAHQAVYSAVASVVSLVLQFRSRSLRSS